MAPKKRGSSTEVIRITDKEGGERFDIEVPAESALDELGLLVTTLTHHVKEIRKEHTDHEGDLKEINKNIALLQQTIGQINATVADMDKAVVLTHDSVKRVIEMEEKCPVKQMALTGSLQPKKSESGRSQSSGGGGGGGGWFGKLLNPQVLPLVIIALLVLLLMAMLGVTSLSWDKSGISIKRDPAYKPYDVRYQTPRHTLNMGKPKNVKGNNP